MPPPSVISDLQQLLPTERILTDPSELFVYDSDGFTIARNIPQAVVFPTSTQEVAGIVKLLAERDVQIVPRGSGTGLTGGCVAFENGVVVSTARMNKVLKIDLENRVAHVEAGVRNTALSDAVAQLPLNVEIDADDVRDVHPTTSPSRDPVNGSAGANLKSQISNSRSQISNPYH